MPYITNGNIYAPVMMLAEKAADLILGNTPLAEADVPFYRHTRGDPLYPPGDSRNAAPKTSPNAAQPARPRPGRSANPPQATPTPESRGHRMSEQTLDKNIEDGSSPHDSAAALEVRNLWKIFGPKADKIIGGPDADLSRADLKEKTRVRHRGQGRLLRRRPR